MLDKGSQASFISEDTVQLLGLKRTHVTGSVTGLGHSHRMIKHAVTLEVESRQNAGKSIVVKAHVLKSLTSLLPSTEICIPHWLELRELPLADPKFATPSRVDMLLRANVFGDILLTRLKKSPFSNLIAQNTVFGWILSRKVSQELNSEKITTLHVQVKEDELLIRFWDIENEPNSIEKFLTEEEKLYMRKLL